MRTLLHYLSVIPAAFLFSQTAHALSRDVHSYSNPEQIRVEHVALDLKVDFNKQVLQGQAELTLKRLDPNVDTVILDTRDLQITSIQTEQQGGWQPVSYELKKADPNLGSALHVQLPKDSHKLRISYTTGPGASALQWLTPAQTAGKKQPFLFTQSAAINARSWVPLQDSPGVRITYEAIIHAPPALMAVMSAAGNPQIRTRDGVYRFRMPQAIPAYLMALAVGDLAFKSLGSRTGVYTESVMLEKTAAELSDTETMVQTAEKLYGKYRWNRYDMLVLPPSFPVGGMENPRLSFITPTIIAGDKSLVSLIAHELAHSWSGNLVSNATWRDLWLNEGFTSYVESRIMEAIYGQNRAAMEGVLEYQNLQAELAKFPPSDQILAIDLTGRSPEDVFTQVPYIKGMLFLKTLEHRFGRATFDAFLKSYFDHFAFQSIRTEQFVDYLNQHLIKNHPDKFAMSEVEAWIHQPGLPKQVALPVSSAFEEVARHRGEWLAGLAPVSHLPTQLWTVHEWLYCINTMPDTVKPEQLQALDKAFDLTRSQNSEIAHAWLLLAIKHRYEPAYVRLQDYLQSIGRRKLVKPLYEALLRNPQDQALAKTIYAKARPGYHPLLVHDLDALMKPQQAAQR